MRRMPHKLAFAVMVAGALGFGGTQAFAAPGAREVRENSCTYISCRMSCREACLPSGFACTGYCDPDAGCVCEYV